MFIILLRGTGQHLFWIFGILIHCFQLYICMTLFLFLYLNRVLNTLNQTLVSMGVDMSQASVSVELDIGKRTSSGTSISALGGCETYDHAHKKLRREQS